MILWNTDLVMPSSKHWELRAAVRAFERMVEETARSERRNRVAALVTAAMALAREEGDFTVKQVAERAGVALQTLYRHFGTKDELVLAVIEEDVAEGAAHVASIAATLDDPVERLRAIVRQPIMTAAEGSMTGLRFHVMERARLVELHPEEVEAALSPYRDLLIRAISDASEAGEVHPVDEARDADVVLHLVMTYAHSVAFGAAARRPSEVADFIWDFCLAALQRDGGDDPVDRPAVDPAREGAPCADPTIA